MTEAYLPRSLDELADLLTERILVEGHTVDFKRELSKGASANKEMSKDLAAFAIDGGRIFIGVDEGDRDSGVPPSLSPVELDGLKERIDSIARSAVDPPLAVRCIELHDEAEAARGVLVVEVPPSAEAPHKAAERFWGRGDTTNYVLSAAEVEALYQRRARSRAQIEELLDAEIARDPTPEHMRVNGHVFAFAEPAVPDDDRLRRALGDEEFVRWFNTEVRPLMQAAVAAPDLGLAGSNSLRAGGWAVHDYCISPERTVRPNGDLPAKERQLIDLEVLEGGGVRLFNGRGTDVAGGDGVREAPRVIVDAVFAATALRAVQVAHAVSVKCEYRGSWHLGLAGNRLRGLASAAASRNFMSDATGYSADDYRRVTTATFDEIEAGLPVLERLVAPLLRGLGSPFDLEQLG